MTLTVYTSDFILVRQVLAARRKIEATALIAQSPFFRAGLNDGLETIDDFLSNYRHRFWQNQTEMEYELELLNASERRRKTKLTRAPTDEEVYEWLLSSFL